MKKGQLEHKSKAQRQQKITNILIHWMNVLYKKNDLSNALILLTIGYFI